MQGSSHVDLRGSGKCQHRAFQYQDAVFELQRMDHATIALAWVLLNSMHVYSEVSSTPSSSIPWSLLLGEYVQYSSTGIASFQYLPSFCMARCIVAKVI